MDKDKLDQFLGLPTEKEIEDKKQKTIKEKDGLLESTIIEKVVYLEDGRQLLKEDLPITSTNRSFLR